MKRILLNSFFILLIAGCSAPQSHTREAGVVPDSIKGTYLDYSLSFKERSALLVKELTLEEKMQQLVYDAPAIDRLNIPAYNWWNEALHGIARFGTATVFPQPVGMAATFDRELIHSISSAISTEGRAKHNEAVRMGNHTQYGGLTYWSPNVNLFRDPRWGRGMETWGEDPYLTGELGAQFVNGIQGNHPKYLKAAACAKHYVVHSGPEADRHFFNAKPPKSDFYNTYLPSFKKLVTEAQVEAVMCAYNRTYDEPCCGSEYLLQDILRTDWGFEGHILSDCWAILDINQYQKLTKTAAESAALALKSGVNLNCGDAYDELPAALKQGLITEADIDKALIKLLETRFKLGLFDPTDMVPFNDIGTESVNAEEHISLARQAAAKSVVLLKNNGVLPLDPALKELYVIGPTASDLDAMIGNYPGISNNVVTIVEGIAGAISPGTRMEYRKGFMLDRRNLNDIGWAISEAQNAAVTIVSMGINTELEGEEGESIASPTRSDRLDLNLPENQLEYLRRIRQNNGNPLIVVMTGGSPIAIQEVYELADALIWCWYPGEQGGNAVSDVIFGKTSPAGKLPITFPYNVEQLPAYDDYAMEGRTYRYMEKEPLFPFGFGLTYSDFSFDMKLGKTKLGINDSTVAEVTVTNNGSIASDEVVQLYISSEKPNPYPLYQLINFDRIHLKPGESRSVSFNLKPEHFSVYNENGILKPQKGTFTISAGNALPSERSRVLGAEEPAVQELTFGNS